MKGLEESLKKIEIISHMLSVFNEIVLKLNTH
jgi:hypothetical protein